jgi:hypothetical protein
LLCPNLNVATSYNTHLNLWTQCLKWLQIIFFLGLNPLHLNIHSKYMQWIFHKFHFWKVPPHWWQMTIVTIAWSWKVHK